MMISDLHVLEAIVDTVGRIYYFVTGILPNLMSSLTPSDQFPCTQAGI